MRELGILQTGEQYYKITMQEEGKRRAHSEPRYPLKIYEKDTNNGGWSHLETLDAEKPTANKNSAFTDMKSPSDAWDDAIDAIRFYDHSDIISQRQKF